ncbi:kelch repeat-containing protein [Sorangium sp. So ce341]|uniref:kelch repeat-containing protein n=1 Tax=Sorangium sp. So ce341 TaxID=3133302 RepID=UPI003F602EC9
MSEARMVRRTLLFVMGSLAAGCAGPDPVWTSAGSLLEARAHHSATLLEDERILFAGGRREEHLSSAELLDTRSGRWAVGDSLREARERHTATRLDDGRVILIGGEGGGGVLRSAEVYSPAEARFSSIASMAEPRTGHTATLLSEGQILLIAGGAGDGAAQASAELFDTAVGVWSEASSMREARRSHTATPLDKYRVLVAGGAGESGASRGAEIYDVPTGTWTEAGTLLEARRDHTATRLRNGDVLVAGGLGEGGALASVEIYDVNAGIWRSGGALREARHGHTATRLDNGQVLVVGGTGDAGSLSSAEIYDDATDGWSSAGSTALPRAGHTATWIASGEVVVAGGDDDGGATTSVERFTLDATCERTEDCPAALICNAENRCEHPPAPLDSRSACSASHPGSSASGGAALAALLSILAASCGRRARRSSRAAAALLTGALLLAWPRRSEAQEPTFYLDRLQVAGAPDDGMAVWRPAIGPTRLFAQATVNYAHNALRVETFVHDPDRARALRGPAVSSQLTTHYTVGAELLERGAIQVSVPLIVLQRGFSTESRSAGLDQAVSLAPPALGDLRVDGRVLLARNEARTFQLAARAALFLPAGDESSFAGDRSAWGNAGLAAEYDAGSLLVALNVGASIRPESTLVDLTVGTELVYGLAAYVPLLRGRLRLGAELFGSAGLLSETLGAIESAPLEWSVVGRFGTGGKAPLFVGIGAGSRIAAGYAPDARLVAMIGGALSMEREETAPPRLVVSSATVDQDGDGDGLPDAQDACPAEPEDRRSVDDGCPDRDRDGDGLLDAIDKCAAAPEDKDGVDDADGCPEDDVVAGAGTDGDGDGVADVADRCPKEPGVHAEDPEKDGCPAFLRLDKTQVALVKQIEFASGRATIDPSSYPIIDELARLLEATPDIKVLRIEGHTDNLGDPAYNQRLSQQRAAAVRDYLVKQGRVDPARLTFQGLGSARPLMTNDTPEGRAKNRRVELHIVE